MSTPVDVTIVSGFLGAGKTTYIVKQLLPSTGGETLVVLNEIGPSETELSLFAGSEPLLLTGGCVCCEHRDELRELLRDLVGRARATPISRIIIELTGVAHPERVAQLLVEDPLLCHRTRLGELVVVADALALRQTLSQHAEASAQLAAADRVLLSKGDLCDARTLSDAAALVRCVNPDAAIDCSIANVEPHLVAEPPRLPGPERAHLAKTEVVTLEFTRPLTWQVFGTWLTLLVHAHGPRLLRFKARIDTGGEGPVLLDAVQDVVHQPRHLSSWSGVPRGSRMTFIARGLDVARLSPSLEAFEAAFSPLARDPGQPADQPS